MGAFVKGFGGEISPPFALANGSEESLSLLFHSLDGRANETSHDCGNSLVGQVSTLRHFLDNLSDGEQAIRLCGEVSHNGFANALVGSLLSSRLLLGRVLLSYIMREKGFNKKLQFTYGENGKPYLKNSSTFFNISHSGNYVVCSISESEIGCDVQTVEKYNPRIAERFFTESEKLFLQKSENPSEDFTRLWAMKESVLKKTGEGITGGLNTFSFENCLAESRFSVFAGRLSGIVCASIAETGTTDE